MKDDFTIIKVVLEYTQDMMKGHDNITYVNRALESLQNISDTMDAMARTNKQLSERLQTNTFVKSLSDSVREYDKRLTEQVKKEQQQKKKNPKSIVAVKLPKV